jgi:hypothetical protein
LNRISKRPPRVPHFLPLPDLHVTVYPVTIA